MPTQVNYPTPSYRRKLADDSYFGFRVPLDTVNAVKVFSNSGITLPYTSMVSPLTFCVWVKTSLSSRGQILLSNSSYYATATNTFPFQFWINSTGGFYTSLDAGGDYSADQAFTVSSSVNDNNWHHVGLIYVASSSFKIYVDGVKIDDRAITVTCNNASLSWCLGTFAVYNSQTAAGNAFNGSLSCPIFAPSINSESIIFESFKIKP